MPRHLAQGAFFLARLTGGLFVSRMGPLPFPRRQLNPLLREHYRIATRDKRPVFLLAVIAGFPHSCQLSEVLHARRVPATPLTVRRLQRVAEAIGFNGALFLDEEEP